MSPSGAACCRARGPESSSARRRPISNPNTPTHGVADGQQINRQGDPSRQLGNRRTRELHVVRVSHAYQDPELPTVARRSKVLPCVKPAPMNFTPRVTQESRGGAATVALTRPRAAPRNAAAIRHPAAVGCLGRLCRHGPVAFLAGRCRSAWRPFDGQAKKIFLRLNAGGAQPRQVHGAGWVGFRTAHAVRAHQPVPAGVRFAPRRHPCGQS